MAAMLEARVQCGVRMRRRRTHPVAVVRSPRPSCLSGCVDRTHTVPRRECALTGRCSWQSALSFVSWPESAAQQLAGDYLLHGFLCRLHSFGTWKLDTPRDVLALLYGLWIIVGRLSPAPDLSPYPTTAYRLSLFLMGGVLSGVVEETAFRGYMQTGLERHDPKNAVLITSLVFVGSHITQGLPALLVLGPGLFAASILYGLLVQRTGTILPGIVIHVVGDLLYFFFGVLRGNADPLFAS